MEGNSGGAVEERTKAARAVFASMEEAIGERGALLLEPLQLAVHHALLAQKRKHCLHN